MSDDSPEIPTETKVQTAEQEASVGRLIALAAPLAVAGAVAIAIEYSGSGDEGSVQAVFALDARGEMLDAPMPDGVAEELETFTPSGYEWGEGGYGQVRLDLATGSVVVDHNDYILSTEESTHVYIPAEAT
jgi:hypothetical protein